MPSYLATSLPRTVPGLPTMLARSPTLMEQAAQAPRHTDFTAALRAEGLSCIAEIKRRSPSKGDLDAGPPA